ncbi:Htur_1727 family rSAM-partnered candidate RiPP [Halomicrobium urmianum]|uniref:Htur_1727 family rSAM-partnered candidate RiPP n=1 Tax=Halomicrobium urmianum TaxID=1586233 RepID=UPI001CD985B0|nr:Htur_1727 family rSAM-partnered candidate RiPP [Halomicrobium urmianum]
MTEDATELDHKVDAQRSSTALEWEVFVREADRREASDRASGSDRRERHASRDGDPLTHAGSVTAPTEEIAVEQAEKLFGHAATTLWLCPATEVTRRTTEARALAER